MITTFQLQALKAAGFEFEIDRSAEDGGADSITVKESVSCQSGAKSWVETRNSILVRDQDVIDFISERIPA